MTESTESSNNNDTSPEAALAEKGSEISADQESGDALQSRVQELEAQITEKEKKYAYLYADFDNFKKRSARERSDLLKFGWESVARDLLFTVDNLERALSHTSSKTDKTLVEGLTLVLSQFKATLKKQGLEEIVTLEKEYDPNFHEAISQEPSDLPSGTILKEHSRGYTLNGRLLRPSQVVVSQGPSGEPNGVGGEAVHPRN